MSGGVRGDSGMSLPNEAAAESKKESGDGVKPAEAQEESAETRTERASGAVMEAAAAGGGQKPSEKKRNFKKDMPADVVGLIGAFSDRKTAVALGQVMAIPPQRRVAAGGGGGAAAAAAAAPVADVPDKYWTGALKGKEDSIATQFVRECIQEKRPFTFPPAFTKAIREKVHHLDLSELYVEPKDIATRLAELKRTFPNLNSLNLGGRTRYYGQVTSEMLTEVHRHFPALVSLQFIGSAIKDAECQLIATCWPDLQNLDLIDCDGVTGTGYAHLVTLLKLKSLSLPGITAQALVSLASIKELHTLRIDDCRGLSRAAFASLAKLTELRTLGIRNSQNITVTELRSFLPSLAHLVHLSFRKTSIDDEALTYLGEQKKLCEQLQSLDLQGSKNITYAGLSWLSRCMQLEKVDLGKSSGLERALPREPILCPCLRELNLEKCKNSTSRGIASLKGPRLEKLNLHGEHIQENTIDDAVLQAVAASYPNLRELDLTFCWRVTSAGIQYLRGCPQLEILDLTATKVDATVLQKLGENCPNLRELFLDHIHSADFTQAVTYCCAKLEKLDVSKTTVNDTWLQNLAEGCPNLRELALFGCENITAKGMKYLVDCRALEKLFLTTYNVTDEALQHFARYQNLQRLALPNNISQAGIDQLQRALGRSVKITRNNVYVFKSILKS